MTIATEENPPGASLIIEFGTGAEEMAYRLLAEMSGYVARIDGRDVEIAAFEHDGPALRVRAWSEADGPADFDERVEMLVVERVHVY